MKRLLYIIGLLIGLFISTKANAQYMYEKKDVDMIEYELKTINNYTNYIEKLGTYQMKEGKTIFYMGVGVTTISGIILCTKMVKPKDVTEVNDNEIASLFTAAIFGCALQIVGGYYWCIGKEKLYSSTYFYDYY